MARSLFTCFGKSSSAPTLTTNKQETTPSATSDLTAEEKRRGGPVVIELFSSQGCKASSQAELLLSRVGRGDFNIEIPVILLSYHVDIWDYMGWKDRFGSSQWTVRQKAYVEALQLDELSTPQVVAQGRAQCVGDDEEVLLDLIKSAPRFPPPTFKATFQRPSKESLKVSLNGALRTKIESEVHIMVALYECGLITSCDSGANNDRVLANDYVVRKLEKLCSVNDIGPKKSVSGTLEFPLWDGFKSSKCGVTVFLQNPSHQIFGSQKFQLPSNL